MEGVSNEAASLAGHWGLGKLIAFYDDNQISIDGNTDISFTEDVSARYEALGWHVEHVKVQTRKEFISKASEGSLTDSHSPVCPSFWSAHTLHSGCAGPNVQSSIAGWQH